MASPTQWKWVCVNSRSWRWTGRPGMLHSVRPHKELDTTEQLNWTALMSMTRFLVGERSFFQLIFFICNFADGLLLKSLLSWEFRIVLLWNLEIHSIGILYYNYCKTINKKVAILPYLTLWKIRNDITTKITPSIICTLNPFQNFERDFIIKWNLPLSKGY